MTMKFRAAAAADTDVVALMHESSRAAIDATFELRPGTAAKFLAADFARGDGLFGFHHQVVAVDPTGMITGTATVYEGSRYLILSRKTMRSVLTHFSLTDTARIIRRTAASATAFPPPRARTFYLANFCVRKENRSTGQGARLLEYVAAQATAERMTAVELDVAFDNPRARAMYERNGFTVTAERHSKNPATGLGGGIHRMTRPLPTT